VEKGLVRVVALGERYALLETIRAFAAEQLHAGGEVPAVRKAHADYFLTFTRQVEADIKGNAQVAAVHRARRDNANTQAAIQWLVSSARAGDGESLEKGLLLTGYLNWFWHMSAQHITSRVILDVLLGLASDCAPSRGRAGALLSSAMISTVTGEWDRCLNDALAARSDALAVDDAIAAAEAVMFVGYCRLHNGQMEEARAALDDAIARSANGVAESNMTIAMTMKGMVLFATGEIDAGIALVEESRVMAERRDDHELRGVAMSFLAQMTLAKGDHAQAVALYRDALVSLELVGDRPEMARVYCEMGWTALAALDVSDALGAFRLAVRAYEEVGSPRGTGLALMGLAAVEAAAGRPERAVTIAAAADALSQRAGIVVDHTMDPGVVGRIEALKASIPRGTLDGIVANASELTPAAVLAMVGAA
jgi:tetratricopeptide (TPR) repeat protein